ncbi:MAG: right-handed parallel beta-helix repeat-containing protein [Anaerolineae bacterium]|nr:right-handed parallel beta-helix repeat-containing protein [Phycisphaerae bacterium]
MKFANNFEALETRTLCSVYSVTSEANSGPGSLREALTLSNNSVDVYDTIEFHLNGAPGQLFRIKPTTKLPTITDPVKITGATQRFYDGSPQVDIDGSLCTTAGANGLEISTSNSLIVGLAFANFAGGAGVRINGNSNGVHECYMGLRGYGAANANARGVYIAGGSGNVIGANGAYRGNVISGNAGSGVRVIGETASYNTIRGNLIGTNVYGRKPIGNGAQGVYVGSGVTGTFISGNTISGNAGNGIQISGGDHTTIKLNNIGLDRDGGGFVPNGANGIRIDNGGHHNTIGVLADPSAQNKIACNDQDGVCIVSGVANTIAANEIRDNGQLGIDLGNDGITPNDVGDADAGANTLLNAPTVVGAYWYGGTTQMHIAFTAAPSTTYTCNVFYNDAPNQHGLAEGGKTLATLALTTNAGGQYDGWIPSFVDAPNAFLSATLTDPAGNTSEFSNVVHVRNDATRIPTMTITDAIVIEGNRDTSDVFLTVRLSSPLPTRLKYHWTSVNGTAFHDQDFIGSGTGSIAAGQTTDVIRVRVVDDTVPEPQEFFGVVISPDQPALVDVTKFQSTVAILANDGWASPFDADRSIVVDLIA